MRFQTKFLIFVFVTFILGDFVMSATVGDLDESQFTVGVLMTFITGIDSLVTNVITGTNDISAFMQWFLLGNAIIYMAWSIGKYTFGVHDLFGIIIDFCFVLFMYLLYTNYILITDVIADLFISFGGSMQALMIGSDDLFIGTLFLERISDSISFYESGIFGSLFTGIVLFFLWFITFWVNLLAFLIIAYAIFIVYFMKLFGFLFIPLMLWKPTQNFLVNWFTTFCSYLLYLTVARLVVASLVMFYIAFFNLPSAGAPVTPIIIEVESDGLDNMVALLMIEFLAILILANAEKISSAIISGATGAGSARRHKSRTQGDGKFKVGDKTINTNMFQLR